MYCCIMPSVQINKDSMKLEELNQNDSGISPSYCSGDSGGSDHMSPVSSTEECGIPAPSPLNLSDHKSQEHGNRKSPQLAAVAISQPQLSLFRSLSFAATQPRSPLGNRNASYALSVGILNGTANGPDGTSDGVLNGGTSSFALEMDKAQSPRSPRFNFHDSSRSMSPASSVDSNDCHDREHPLQQLALVVKRNELLVPTPPDTAETNSSDKALIHCPLCNYTTNSRTTFNSHLHSHEGQKCCYICELMTESVEQLREHYQNVHDVNVSSDFLNHSSGGEEEPGITVPKLNSQGKVKKHRCKQCGIVCVTKLEFWEHCRGHIKQERLLTCPKCPFVTEYKHHLEYHLRNHFGSKPFKCSKCSYSCVNKSMLNSHLKSHSNVYQFRCNDCSYATKYCHSLKLHLRKYKHTPAMVLNPDGSPNPLPIVDVYGTRRGPKQRPKKLTSTAKSTPLIQTLPNRTQFHTQTQFAPSSVFPPSHTQFLPTQTQRSSAPKTFSVPQTTFSPTHSPFSPAQTTLPTNQARFSPNQTPSSPSPLPSTQAQFPSNAQFQPSQTPYSVFPSNYGLFPPFPYPLVPNSIPFPSLSLLQLDIPALLEEAKRSAETLEKLKQLLQSNNNNSQYISKAVAQQIIDEASKPSTPSTHENFSAAPLDLSKSTQSDNGYPENQNTGNSMSSSSIGSNRRKGKAVKRVAIPSMFSEDSDYERRSPLQFGVSNLMSGAQKIY